MAKTDVVIDELIEALLDVVAVVKARLEERAREDATTGVILARTEAAERRHQARVAALDDELRAHEAATNAAKRQHGEWDGKLAAKEERNAALDEAYAFGTPHLVEMVTAVSDAPVAKIRALVEAGDLAGVKALVRESKWVTRKGAAA